MRRLAMLAVGLAAAMVGPRLAVGTGGDAWFEGDLAKQDALARTVIADFAEIKTPTVYRTGNRRFDGQASVAIEQMALLGLGQIILDHPEKKSAYLTAMRAIAERLLDPATLTYAEEVYGRTGIEALGSAEGHAYLGYANLGLGMLRLVDPDMPLAKLHDRITAHLAARIDASANGMIETYPDESWPPDVSAVVGSIGLHAKATGKDESQLLARWEKRFSACALHSSGFLFQRLGTGTCKPVDAPRGSGTAIAAYFLGFATPNLAAKLYASLETVDVGGFGGVREYATGFDGHGDIDAGPIVFGISVGATGFAVGAARANGDRDRFVSYYRSVRLFGLETSVDGRTSFAAGGLLGNALLLAMLTARAPSR